MCDKNSLHGHPDFLSWYECQVLLMAVEILDDFPTPEWNLVTEREKRAIVQKLRGTEEKRKDVRLDAFVDGTSITGE